MVKDLLTNHWARKNESCESIFFFFYKRTSVLQFVIMFRSINNVSYSILIDKVDKVVETSPRSFGPKKGSVLTIRMCGEKSKKSYNQEDVKHNMFSNTNMFVNDLSIKRNGKMARYTNRWYFWFFSRQNLMENNTYG